MKKSSHTFYFPFLLILFSSLLMTFSSLAQTQNSAEVIQRYERGEITRPTAEEKSILRSYLNERMQQVSPIQRSPVSDAPLATFISENFATGSVTTPPAGWTQNRIAGDPTFDFWHFDNPGVRTLNAPITSPAAIFDSDNYSLGGGPENVALESPVFSVPAAATVFLEWNQYFLGGFGGEINVEVYNGSSWVNVYTTTTTTPNPDFQSINISTHVVGIANAQIRFRWVGDYSWYWIVDNVKVYSTATGLTGTKNIPGDYATLELAINDLNLQGVGNGGVTLNLIAGNPQTAPAGGYIIGGTGSLVLTTTGPFDQVTIQGNGNTITAFTPQTSGQLYDGIFKIIGADWITITNFTMLENPANTVTTAGTNDMTEWGVAVLYESATNGAQNNTISSCIIDLNRTYQNTFGVYSNSTHTPTAVTVTASATGPAGGNHGLKIIGNQITDVNQGIVVVGPTAAADYNNGLMIGGTAPTGNTIYNYGTTGTFSSFANVSATVNGILMRNTINFDASYNSIASSVGGVTSGTLYGIQVPAFSVAPLGTFTNSITNNSVSLQSGLASGIMNGINCAGTTASTTSTININNNNFHTFGHTVSGTGAITFILNSGTHLNHNIISNTFTNITVNTTGSVTFISSSNTLPAGGVKNVNNNAIVTQFTKTGSGGTVLFFTDNGSDPNTATNNSNGNIFSNVTVSGTTAVTGISNTNGGSPIKNVIGNIINNIVCGTGAFLGLTINFDGGTTTVTANTVTSVTGGGAITGLNFGTSSAGITYAFNNTINSLTGTGTGIVSAIATGGTGTGRRDIFNHNIYNLENNNAGGSAFGIIVSSGTINVYNNFISDVRAPICSLATDGVRGISITSTTTTSGVRLYYNSIYLNAGSTGANFSSSGIFHTNSTTATTAELDMRNNVVVNVSVPQGTGLTIAFRRSAVNAALNNYSTLSNNNDFYAGTPGPANLIFYDGTNADQTMTAFKTRVAPRESNSFSENPPFLNVAATPYNLHMNTAIATQIESGGTPVNTPIAVTNDFDGDSRNLTTPDVGADEFNGILLDLLPPAILYTPLANTGSTSSRILNATITDVTGVPISGIGLPVLYWKKNFNGTWTAATAGSPTGSSYPFTFGAGVAVGDTIFYYIVAQDNVTPPNVGAFPSNGAGGFTANPPAAATPPTNPSFYFITQSALSGNYTVGITLFNQVSGRNITFEKSVNKVMREVMVESDAPQITREKGAEYEEAIELSHTANGTKQMVEVEEISWNPMENGIPYYGDLFVKKVDEPNLDFPEGIDGIYLTITAAIADLNLRGVSGATNFLLTDATYPTETYPLTIDITNEAKPTSVNTVTFKPNTGVTVTVSGASAAAQIFKIFNSYVSLDGSNSGGTSRDWTIENTSTTTPQVVLIGSRGTTPITNVTVKNCIIRNGITSSSALVVSDGNAPGTAGWFNNITIQNNSIQKAYIGNYNISVVSPGNGTGLLVQGNDFNSLTPNHIALVGVYVQGVDGATITNNHIGNYTTTYTANVTGVWFATGTINSTISNNTIGPINITTAAPRGIVVTSAVSNANVTVSGNVVDSMLTTYTVQSYGIWVFSTTTGVVIENNKVSNIQNTNAGGYGARGIHVSTGMASTNITIRNNFVTHVRATSDASSTYWGIGIGIEGATTGVNVFHNSVNLYDTLAGLSAATIHAAFAVITSTAALLDVRDNVFVNSFNNVNSTTDRSYAIYSVAPNTAFTDINYNDYYASGAAGALGFLGVEITTLGDWQTATGDDANSLSVDPQFVSNTDLHINTAYNNVGDKGVFIPSVTTDIDGDTRSVTTPDIGADEYIFVPPTVVDPTNVSATAISSSQIDVAFTPNANNNNVVIVFNLTGVFTPPVGPPPAPGDPFAGGTFLTSTLTSPYSHTGLTQNTHYYYKLFSYNGTNYSPGVAADATTFTTPLAGDYTVGLSMFNQFSGLNITFEQRVRTIEVTETIVNQEAAEQIGIYEETLDGTVTLQEPADETALAPVTVTRTVEQQYFVPLLNGREYDGSLYYELTYEQRSEYKLGIRGVYATITEAVNDAVLKGVSAAVRFLLVDATYPSETFPIVIPDITGVSAVNTVSILPNTGVTTTITGSIALPIFDLNSCSYIVIDGRQNGVGATNSLTISNTSTAASASCVRFMNGATFNAVQFVNLIAQPSTSTTRALEFFTSATEPSGNSNNLISNCDVNSGRYCIYFSGTAANPNMNNTIANSKFYDATFAEFYMVSNASSTTIVNNEFFNVIPQGTANYALSISSSAMLGVNNIIGNKFYDLQNTSTSTLRGITVTPGAGSTVNIINNFFSFTQDNGTKTSIYAIQISGTTEHTANIHYNTFNFAGVHTGGSAGVIVSGGLIKSNTGATSVFNAKNNVGKNTRTGGTSGVVHTNFFVGTTAIVGTLDINYNAWWASGDPGSFCAGWGGTVYNDLTLYKAAATPHEQQTIFKDVNFVSGVDLHLAGLSIGDADLAGLPLAGITDDIDGDVRDLVYPYRGADESAVKFLPISGPSNLVAIPDTLTAELSWQDNSNNEGGFIIQRKDGDSTSVNPFTNIDTVATNVIYYLNSGLNPNTTYTWRVFAINALGTSGYSNMATATTFIPVELTSFTAELSGREILVNWATATELNNRGFDIERKMDGEWEKIGFKEGRGTTTTESSYSFIDKFTYESFVGTITYRLKQMDFNGTYAYSPEVEVNVDFTPKEYTLYQNYPNPFNPVTTIKYSLPFESNVRISVYNILGEMLEVLVDETKQVGFHDYNWNASNLASGIYIYTIEAKSVAGDKNYSSVKKMILMK